jgi:O-acetyl-ADP-ribose deacetylase (regulator of RNase III)
VREGLEETPGIRQVIFVCFDRENYRIYEELIKENFGASPLSSTGE